MTGLPGGGRAGQIRSPESQVWQAWKNISNIILNLETKQNKTVLFSYYLFQKVKLQKKILSFGEKHDNDF